MSDPFIEQLRRSLHDAVDDAQPSTGFVAALLAEASSGREPRVRARRLAFPRTSVLAGGLVALVAAAVVAGAVVLVHGSLDRGSSVVMGRLPSAREGLSGVLGVLRRPATPADRNAVAVVRRRDQHVHTSHPQRPLWSQARLATKTPWGQNIVLIPVRIRGHGEQLEVDDGGGSGCCNTATEILAGRSSMTGGSGSSNDAELVVPDGVAKVRVDFSHPITAAVHGNVAAFQTPTAIDNLSVYPMIWYGADGKVVKRIAAAPGGPSRVPVRKALSGNALGNARFGQGRARVRLMVEELLGDTEGKVTQLHDCGIDYAIQWREPFAKPPVTTFIAFFSHRRFVGYSYGPVSRDSTPRPSSRVVAATTRGLKIGDTLARGQQLYGQAFRFSNAQGGTWSVRTATGEIRGWAYPPYGKRVGPHSRVAVITAGHVGCPATSP